MINLYYVVYEDKQFIPSTVTEKNFMSLADYIVFF
jgi:hypothetical protein